MLSKTLELRSVFRESPPQQPSPNTFSSRFGLNRRGEALSWTPSTHRLNQSESVCQTPLERQYHTEIMAQERTRGRRNCRIFTYTDSDCYTNWEGHSQSMVTQVKSNPTLLAHRMANVRHRRQDRRPVDSTIPKSRLITWEPLEDFVKTSHMVNTPLQTMHIMGDLGPADLAKRRRNACLHDKSRWKWSGYHQTRLQQRQGALQASDPHLLKSKCFTPSSS
ncbi:tectonic-like complex member MKS1 isoform X2 [Oncorhynchus keta]|uniref:tectonic-like complex member MKS1 isoform X2 n=1 Tax=Oncorhynchus keta TaxID=8018 RepID=UPI00227BB099|nr:tectonic-like complex member MKS1 isoform X2 [Oncorhynchus keta]